MPKAASSAPLAERVRPMSLDDFIGQEQLVGNNQFIKTLIDTKRVISMIFWGPPGSGKTTLARILAKSSGLYFIEISAVTQGLPDVKKVIQQARELQKINNRTLLFVDEIHRFNKAQQDALLPHVESGLLTLIGATTENPSFEVIGPLLSRCRVVVLEQLNEASISHILKRGAKELELTLNKSSVDMITHFAGGDARMALNILEATSLLGSKINTEHVKQAAQTAHMRYDKGGEAHYNTISAFIKSLRGSQIDAALFYLGRMLEAGEDPIFIARRMVIFASEDIGEAWHGALTLSLNVFQAVERVGLPEGAYALTQGVIALAKAPKSRSVADSLQSLKQAAHEHFDAPVPLQLRNAPTKLMKNLGYGKGYKWRADYQHEKGFMPDSLNDLHIYKQDA